MVINEVLEGLPEGGLIVHGLIDKLIPHYGSSDIDPAQFLISHLASLVRDGWRVWLKEFHGVIDDQSVVVHAEIAEISP
jgi:hypothetical protein